MNKLIGLLTVGVMTFGSITPALAQSSSSQSLQDLINQLKQQVDTLNSQLNAAKQTQQDIKSTLKLIRQLRAGMSGEDVKLLQEILATDPEVYPEGIKSGFFGKLTAKAVAQFQKKHGLSQVGVVGPKTLERLNEILKEGAGNSGKVPPGLLIAPGIKKKFGPDYKPMPLPGQKLPPGIEKKIGTTTPPATTTPDTIAPVISELHASSTTATATDIRWKTDEAATGIVWYATAAFSEVSNTTSRMDHVNLVSDHLLSLSGLTASTTYYYTVSSKDAAGNTATSSQQSFVTAQ